MVRDAGFVDLHPEAEAIVKDKQQYARWIDGTPLSNDVPVWMAEFAVMVLRRAAMLGEDE